MTDTRANPRRRPSRLPVAFATIALFLVIAAFLAVRVAQGRDPALGAGNAGPVATPRRVLIRKVVITRHVTVIRPARRTASVPSAAPASAPVQQAPVVVQAAPAPAPTPAPAPVQTSTS